MKGEQQIREFVISTGTARYPTITGQFQIYIKHLKADMRGVDLGVPWYLPDVPYVMYFYSGYGIHGTYWHDNFGTPMSHGCINLTIEDAEWLYNFSEIGTSVKIHH
jgi:lipoprotein-anchoring transpeptidase ErfK/SrfK